MDSPVRVVSVFSSSYTGTTWLNFAMASHPDAFYLGPYDWARQTLKDQKEAACLLHGPDCGFWPGFFSQYDETDNFFTQLAAYAGKSHIIINNPILEEGEFQADLESPRVELIPVIVVRDLRAQFASRLRKYPDVNPVQILKDYVAWCAKRPVQMINQYPQAPVINYELARSDVASTLNQISGYTGLSYQASPERFWEFEHHPVAGNDGPCSFVAFHQGVEYPDFVGIEHYREQFRQTLEAEGGEFKDERWKTELSLYQKFYFDEHYGQINQAFGYERDRFSISKAQINETMLGWVYGDWLDALKQAGINFVTARDVLEGRISLERCNLVLRHDVDDASYQDQIWPMLQSELQRGIRSSTYVFAQNPESGKSSGYFGKSEPFDPEELLYFQNRGFEFGLHVDVVSRCQREGDSVSPEQAVKLLAFDLESMRLAGIEVSTLAAHGYIWPDRVRPTYDNWCAAYDYCAKAGLELAVSENHLPGYFHRQGGRKLTEALPEELVRGLVGAVCPEYDPVHRLRSLNQPGAWDGQHLFLTDSMGIWSGCSIKMLCGLAPRLKGCLVVMLTHPVNYSTSLNGMVSQVEHVDLSDDLALARYADGGFGYTPSYEDNLEFKDQAPSKEEKHFKPGWSRRLYNRRSRVFLSSVSEAHWFSHTGIRPGPKQVTALIEGSPMVYIFTNWFGREISEERRQTASALEVCRNIGSVSLHLTSQGLQANRLNLAFAKPAMAALHRTMQPGANCLQLEDLEEFCGSNQTDMFFAVDWDDGSQDHQRMIRNASRALAPGGLLFLTFVEKSLLGSHGHLFSPRAHLRRIAANAVYHNQVLAWFAENGFQLRAVYAKGHPGTRYPEQLAIAPKTEATV